LCGRDRERRGEERRGEERGETEIVASSLFALPTMDLQYTEK
jgi:hypothetical protein